ncbi:MAG: hypothetical protein P1R74_05365 [Sedimenticola sp.]|nr:hypothetical protein [Sedimenticola sp.]
MKSILAVILSTLLFITAGNALAAKKEGKAYGAGGVSEEHMSESAAEHRKAYAGEKEKKAKGDMEGDEDKGKKKMKKEKKQKKEK